MLTGVRLNVLVEVLHVAFRLAGECCERAGLRGRLLQRIGDSVRRHARLLTVRAGDGCWRAVKAGIRTKTL